MSTLVKAVESAGYADRVISDKQLARIVGGEPARRYGLVNRALKDGSLARIKRGLYVLGGQQQRALHPFVIAQALQSGSYVSLESALSYHAWIPEAVYTTASITPERKSFDRDTDQFGHFSFHTIATERFWFYAAVDRIQFGTSAALVAQPLRALMDLVAFRKVEWQGLDWLADGLRIDESCLAALRNQDFSALRHVYKHRRARAFLSALEAETIAPKSAQSRLRGRNT